MAEVIISNIQGQQKSPRESGIELLRILSAFAVVVLHYNIGGGDALSYSTGVSHELLLVLESLSICAVDVFIMISGYFLCTTTKRTWDKPIYLFLLLWSIRLLTYFGMCFINHDMGGANLDVMLQKIFPPADYFVILYITLYIVSPFFNLTTNKLTDKGRLVMIVVLMLLFSFYPTLMDGYQLLRHQELMGINPVGAWGQQHGYTIVCFSLCYCIGAFIRLNKIAELLSRKIIAIIIVICVMGIYIWYNIEARTVLMDSELIKSNAFSYSNPLVLLLSAACLLFFSKIHFKSVIINTLSKAVFVCYLFHAVILRHIKVPEFAQAGGWQLFLHLLLSLVAIYSISWLLWKILDVVFKPITKPLKNKFIYNVYEE